MFFFGVFWGVFCGFLIAAVGHRCKPCRREHLDEHDCQGRFPAGPGRSD